MPPPMRGSIKLMKNVLSIYVLLLLATLLSRGRSVQPQNGDIRLANGTAVRGRLEVYNASRQVWGTVCYDSREYQGLGQVGAARAACRQLGYMDVKDVDTVASFGIPEAPEDTPILLYELNCLYNDVNDLNNEAEHILRCTYLPTGNCSHTQDMAIECKSASKYTAPYDTEVRLVHGGTGYPSSGIVEIYLNNQWGTVCADYWLTLANPDTVCRQMGYTNATGVIRPDVTSISYAQPILTGLFCELYSYACISNCFSYPTSSATVTCDTGQILAVNCSYDVSVFPSPLAGSETLCKPTKPFNVPAGRLAAIVGGVIGGVIVVVVVMVIVFCCCCFISGCPLHTWRERRLHGYGKIL